jgi:hypothetical protein
MTSSSSTEPAGEQKHFFFKSFLKQSSIRKLDENESESAADKKVHNLLTNNVELKNQLQRFNETKQSWKRKPHSERQTKSDVGLQTRQKLHLQSGKPNSTKIVVQDLRKLRTLGEYRMKKLVRLQKLRKSNE